MQWNVSKKVIGLAALSMITVSAMAYGGYETLGSMFVVPQVPDKNSVPYPQVGELVFDNTANRFYGFGNAGPGDWKDLTGGSSNTSYRNAGDADSTILTSDDVVLGTPTAADRAFTLPTAVGNTGKQIKLLNRSVSGKKITINTTSSETIGGRAGGSIALYRDGDNLSVVSDGANWQIISKKESEFLDAKNGTPCYVPNSSGNYIDCGVTVTLTPGEWEVEGMLHLYFGGNTGMYLSASSGFFAAIGTGNTTAPTALSSSLILNGQKVPLGNTVACGAIVSSTLDQGCSSAPIRMHMYVTSSTAIHLVPKVVTNGSNAGGATASAQIYAKRIW